MPDTEPDECVAIQDTKNADEALAKARTAPPVDAGGAVHAYVTVYIAPRD